MSMINFFKQAMNSLHQNIGDFLVDKKYGLDTVSRVDLAQTSVGIEGNLVGNKYQPSGFTRARKVLQRLKKYGSDGFVDFGSGKGQVLLAASSLGYTNIKGVEFAEELHEIAKSNIKRYTLQNKRKSVPTSICADAGQYKVQPDDKLFYFFYPFKRQLMEQVVENIEMSVSDNPRQVFAVMLYPKDADVFHERTNWTMLERFHLGYIECRLYKCSLGN